jgi:hypothetical protein
LKYNLYSEVYKVNVMIYWYFSGFEVTAVLLKWPYSCKLMKSSVNLCWKWNGLNIHIDFLTVNSEKSWKLFFLPILKCWWKCMKSICDFMSLKLSVLFLFSFFCSRGKILWLAVNIPLLYHTL